MGVFFIVREYFMTHQRLQIMRIAIPDGHIQFDPQNYQDLYSMIILNQIYAKLFRFSPEGILQKDLVESWSVSADQTIYDFKLSERYFSNGERITAQHVVNTFYHLFRHQGGMANDLTYIKGASELIRGEIPKEFGVSVVNQQHVKIKLDRSIALLNIHLACPDLSILPINNPELKKTFNQELVTSGCYKISKTLDKMIEIELVETCPYVLASSPKIIQFIKVNDAAEAFKLAINDKIDSLDVFEFNHEQTEQLKTKGFWPSLTNVNNQWFVILSPIIPQSVREYLFSKLYFHSLKAVEDFGLKRAFGLISLNLEGAAKNYLLIPPENEINLKHPFTLVIDYSIDDKFTVQAVQEAMKLWNDPLLKIELNPLSHKEYLSRMFAKESQIVFGKKGMDYPEGHGILSYFFTNSSWTYFYNFNQKIDDLLNSSVRESDATKRASLYLEIQKRILAEFHFIPLAQGKTGSGLWSKRIQFVPDHPMGMQYLPFESIK
jgi:ABC-type transport system substrate-binding protein